MAIRLKRIHDAPADEDGARILAPEVTWRSTDPQIVAVDEAGTLTAVALGDVEVSATFEGVLLGVPSIAFSQQPGSGEDLERSAAFAARMVESLLEKPPARNQSKLATASPSERDQLRPSAW